MGGVGVGVGGSGDCDDRRQDWDWAFDGSKKGRRGEKEKNEKGHLEGRKEMLVSGKFLNGWRERALRQCKKGPQGKAGKVWCV